MCLVVGHPITTTTEVIGKLSVAAFTKQEAMCRLVDLSFGFKLFCLDQFFIELSELSHKHHPRHHHPHSRNSRNGVLFVSGCLQTKTPSAAEAPQSPCAPRSAIHDFRAERCFCRFRTIFICFARTPTTIHLVQ